MAPRLDPYGAPDLQDRPVRPERDVYNPMSAVPGYVPAPRPAGQNPAASNYRPGPGQQMLSAIQGGGGQFAGNNMTWQDRGGGQHGEVRDARWYQNQVIQALQRQAAGDPNSQAQQQLRQSLANAQAQQASLGSTMRGQGAGAAMRSIRAGQQGIQRGGAGEAQMLQLQEQEAARQMLAQLLAQQQGLDIQGAQNAAAMGLGQTELGMNRELFGSSQALNNAIAEADRMNQLGRARAGFSDAEKNLLRGYTQAGMNAVATGAGAYANMNKSSGSGYRQGNGQDSIAPLEDK